MLGNVVFFVVDIGGGCIKLVVDDVLNVGFVVVGEWCC